MITITQMRIFSTVVDTGSFTKTAQLLNMSQPAVSHTITNLEKELGVNLLIRDKSKGLFLTDIGEKVLFQIRKIENSLEIIAQEVTAETGLESGNIKIAGFPDVSARYLPKIILAVQQNYPNITIQLFEGSNEDVLNWIISRKVDVGFIYSSLKKLDTIPLFTDRYMAVLPVNHRLLDEKAIDISKLADEVLIVGNWGDPKAIEQLFLDRGIPYNQRYTVSNLNTMLGMIKEGLGLSILPEIAIKETEMWENARPIIPDYRRNIELATLSLKNASRATKLFIKIIKEQIN